MKTVPTSFGIGLIVLISAAIFTVIYGIAILACTQSSEHFQHQIKHGKITSVQHGNRIDFYEDGKWIDVWEQKP